MNTLYVSLGSNLGNRLVNLQKAHALINTEIGDITKSSSIYKTDAWGEENLDYFYNQVIEVFTNKTAFQSIDICLEIEKQLGRIRETNKITNRTIDLDILLVNQDIINTEKLIIPHPRLHLRNFVLKPLYEINKKLIIPSLNKNIEELLFECTDINNCVIVPIL